MGFMNKFKGFMGIPEDEYDDEDDLDYDRDFDDPDDEEDELPSFGGSSERRRAPVSVPPAFTLP